jgi:hypothetical protein
MVAAWIAFGVFCIPAWMPSVFAGPPEVNYERVIVLGLDGVSSAGLVAADTPHMDELRENGSSTLGARAVMPTASLPNWGAFLFGADTEQTGITSNGWRPGGGELHPTITNERGFFPSILSLINSQRPELQVGFFTDWASNQFLIEPETVDVLFIPETPTTNAQTRYLRAEETLERALQSIRDDETDFLFIHLDLPDHYGHAHGWETAPYLESITMMDELVGRMVGEIAASDAAESTLLIVVSDHGGRGTSHGGSTAEEVIVPWIIFGAGVRPGADLGPLVRVHDTAATVAHALGLRRPAAWTSAPVLSAFSATPLPVVGVDAASSEPLAVAEERTFVVTATDPNDRDVEIEFDFGDGSRTVWYGPEVSGGSFAVGRSYLVAGSQVVRARAINAGGIVGDWSAVASFEVVGTAPAPGGLTGLWEFLHSENPGQATVGADLSIIGGPPGHFETMADAQVEPLTMQGVLATVAGPGNHFRLPHAIGPNGGGVKTNVYSLVYDVMLPSPIQWHAFIQSDLTNTADADFFVRANTFRSSPAGSLGRGGLGYSTQAVPRDQWQRLVLTFDLRSGGSIHAYLNGVLFHVYSSATLDSRWALDPQDVLVFADENHENQSLMVATLASFDRALSADEVAALGGPGQPLHNGGLSASRDYQDWLAGFPELVDTAPMADPDGDGHPNLMEYLLAGDPLVPNTLVLPSLDGNADGEDLVFQFIRRSASKHTVRPFVEVSESLSDWTAFPVPMFSEEPFTVTPLPEMPGREMVTMALQMERKTRFFARLGAEKILEN